MLGLRVGTRTWSLNCPRNKPAPLSPVLQTLLLSQPDSEGPGATPVLTPSLHHGLLCCSGHRHQDKTEEGLVLHQKLVRYRTSSARRARHPPPLLTHPTGATSGLSLEGRGQGWRGLLHISVSWPSFLEFQCAPPRSTLSMPSILSLPSSSAPVTPTLLLCPVLPAHRESLWPWPDWALTPVSSVEPGLWVTSAMASFYLAQIDYLLQQYLTCWFQVIAPVLGPSAQISGACALASDENSL